MAVWGSYFKKKKKKILYFHFSAPLKCHWPIQANSLKSHSPTSSIYLPLATRRVLMKRGEISCQIYPCNTEVPTNTFSSLTTKVCPFEKFGIYGICMYCISNWFVALAVIIVLVFWIYINNICITVRKKVLFIKCKIKGCLLTFLHGIHCNNMDSFQAILYNSFEKYHICMFAYYDFYECVHTVYIWCLLLWNPNIKYTGEKLYWNILWFTVIIQKLKTLIIKIIAKL